MLTLTELNATLLKVQPDVRLSLSIFLLYFSLPLCLFFFSLTVSHCPFLILSPSSLSFPTSLSRSTSSYSAFMLPILTWIFSHTPCLSVGLSVCENGLMSLCQSSTRPRVDSSLPFTKFHILYISLWRRKLLVSLGTKSIPFDRSASKNRSLTFGSGTWVKSLENPEKSHITN